MAHRYKLRPSFLESIESGSFEDLPEPVYTKTFIKTYAGLLGVDAGPILARYAKYVEKTMPAPPPEAPKEQVREARAENAVFDRLGKYGRQARLGCLRPGRDRDPGYLRLPGQRGEARSSENDGPGGRETARKTAGDASRRSAAGPHGPTAGSSPAAGPCTNGRPGAEEAGSPAPRGEEGAATAGTVCRGSPQPDDRGHRSGLGSGEGRQDAGRAKTHAGGGKADDRGEGEDHHRSRECGRCPDHLPGTIPGEPREARRSDTPGLPGGKAHGEEEIPRVAMEPVTKPATE